MAISETEEPLGELRLRAGGAAAGMGRGLERIAPMAGLGVFGRRDRPGLPGLGSRGGCAPGSVYGLRCVLISPGS